jgi:hypothetical protein
MLMNCFKRLLVGNREFILKEALEVRGFMQLLTKHRNTGLPWSKEEKRELKSHLRVISKVAPVMAVFFLPGGSLLLPLLAEVLDRRKHKRYNGVHVKETDISDRRPES